MLFHVQWKPLRPLQRRTNRIHTEDGHVDLWVRSIGERAELALLFQVERRGSYAVPALLLSVGEKLRDLAGDSPKLTLTPVPTAWLGTEILSIFEGAGFEARLNGRTLELTGQMGVWDAINRASVLSCVLDPQARSYPVLLDKARRTAVSLGLCEALHFKRNAGAAVTGVSQDAFAESDHGAIVSALRKMKVPALVHFNCAGGALIRKIAVEYPLERAIGVEPSKRRADRKLVGFELLHGSLLDPPEGLPSEAAALLSLPPCGDLRLDRAADVLFGMIGFSWIICSRASASLRTWGEQVSEKYGYQMVPASIGGAETLLFRRTRASPAPKKAIRGAGREVTTRAGESIPIENWENTIEAFSSHIVDPRWLCYLPPAIATLQNKTIDEPLEAPELVFDYYRNERIEKLVVERYSGGSHAVAVICRDADAALRRFGTAELGCIYSRKGRTLFSESTEIVTKLREALSRASFWERFQTDWVCLEGEITSPILSSKALQEYEETLAAGEARYEAASSVLKHFEAESRISAVRESIRKFRVLCEELRRGTGAPFSFAPFHLVVVEGRTFFGMTRLWHRETLNALAKRAGGPFVQTPYQFVSLNKAAAVEECLAWARAFPGVVIKPLPFLPKGKRGGAQPAFLSRSSEQLRFVYGPEYDLPENRLSINDRKALDKRKNKRRKILRQCVLAIEGAERFISREPFERIEECVRGVLALD